MKRIEQIHQALCGLEGQGVTAQELARRLGLARPNVSGDLNRLCEMGLAVKSGSKPIYYSAVKREEAVPNKTALDLFLEQNESLLYCGERAKAAVLYPPNGMHMMLLGETGAGKSMFVKLVFHYAREMGRIQSEDAFITFNCADYASNPQLLVSQLFGTKKGAYTGADADKAGLLELADGGILFLDEVHRLPPEGQEVLFTYIDRGVFRRMGETGAERRANVMLVCATTEQPDSALLQTFVRRIPMMIHIPSLAQRTLDERVKLVTAFLLEESRRLGLPIHVTVNSARALLGYDCTGNIGQLRSDIQMLCAQAYVKQVSGASEAVRISSLDLPGHIRGGIYNQRDRRQILNRMAGINRRFLVFDFRDEEAQSLLGSREMDVYATIEQRIEDLQRIGVGEEQIQEELREVLYGYYLRQRSDEDGGEGAGQPVGPEVAATAEKLIRRARGELGYSPGEEIRHSLAMHLDYALSRARLGRGAGTLDLTGLIERTPQLYDFALRCLELVEEELHVRLPKEEAGLLALFFSEGTPTVERGRVQVIVVAHGVGTATSMAKAANRLIDADIVRGFDAPLEEHPDMVYGRVRDYLAALPNVQEALLLVDMGSLSNFAQDLERDLLIRAKRFVLVSTLHVVEAGRKALRGYGLDDIYEDIKSVNELALSDTIYFEHHMNRDRLYLLAVCTTGEGGARVIMEFLSPKLDLQNGLCQIIALGMADRPSFQRTVDALQQTGRIIGVISSFATGLPVNHFELSSVFDGSCIPKLQKTIDTESAFVQVERTLIPMLENISGLEASKNIRRMIERTERNLRCKLEGEMMIGAFCHIGCMLDKLKKGGPVRPFRSVDAVAERYADEVRVVGAECSRLSEIYGTRIPYEEICRITTFFVGEDLISLG